MRWLLLVVAVLGSGCAELHHVAYGEAEAVRGRPFELKVSETGVNLGEAASLARSMSATPQGRQKASDIESIMALFQTGPKTGNTVFNDTYADRLQDDLMKACPSLRIHNLIVVRETQRYPVISGEIVKIKGECFLRGSGPAPRGLWGNGGPSRPTPAARGWRGLRPGRFAGTVGLRSPPPRQGGRWG
ncbi:MAG: hypothetical protein MUF64_31645 [Polyangiaceae bacterium]|nr:hypothetical protein [Polyangiaceae bacterium]